MSFLQLRSSYFKNYPTAPSVTTQAASNITTTSIDGNGTVVSDMGSADTERGFVYSSTNTIPTTADTKVTVGSGVGSFTTTLSGLANSTQYYISAYAINAFGISYGDVVTATTTSAGGAVYIASRMMMGMGL